MEVPATVLEVLKCSSCSVYLSRGPVFLQHDGAAVCGRCYTPKCPATRNTQYEATAKLLKFPCKNRELGCRETVPYVEEAEVLVHEEVCEHRQYVCPVLGSARCDWLGPRTAMLAHCRDQHADRVLENPCNLTHDIARPSLHNYIISAFQILFLLHTKVCLISGKIFHCVRLLGESAKATNFFYNLDIKRNNELVSKEGEVVPQGCLAIQEDTALGINTNSLLDMLGGFDGTTFTLTVKRRVNDAADQLARVVEKCGRCKAKVTVFRYRDVNGWRCDRCVPAKRACNNHSQGCQHIDFDNKCSKHETYYCQQSTQCGICDVAVSRGSISAHYGAVHQDITHEAGSTWWATHTGSEFKWFLVSSVVGTAVCMYKMTDSQFELSVRTSLWSEQLREFRCEVRLTDPATGYTRNFMPDALYDQWYDWKIVVKKEEFQSWNVVFDVNMNIIKI